jgi:hypothetical protein
VITIPIAISVQAKLDDDYRSKKEHSNENVRQSITVEKLSAAPKDPKRC